MPAHGVFENEAVFGSLETSTNGMKSFAQVWFCHTIIEMLLACLLPLGPKCIQCFQLGKVFLRNKTPLPTSEIPEFLSEHPTLVTCCWNVCWPGASFLNIWLCEETGPRLAYCNRSTYRFTRRMFLLPDMWPASCLNDFSSVVRYFAKTNVCVVPPVLPLHNSMVRHYLLRRQDFKKNKCFEQLRGWCTLLGGGEGAGNHITVWILVGHCARNAWPTTWPAMTNCRCRYSLQRGNNGRLHRVMHMSSSMRGCELLEGKVRAWHWLQGGDLMQAITWLAPRNCYANTFCSCCWSQDTVVISGVSGRFPESDSTEEFRQHLLKGEDMVTEDNRRWTPGRETTTKREKIPGTVTKEKSFVLFCANLAWNWEFHSSPGLHGLPRRNGKLKDLSKFDATFFGVHPKQANGMDPQLRMLLEVSYEAIVDAGKVIFLVHTFFMQFICDEKTFQWCAWIQI